MRRSDQRRDAVFAIYQRDVTGRPLEDLLGEGKPFTKDLATGVDANLEEIDAVISENLHGWTIHRVAPLERAIMRVALFEMLHREEIPAPVSIDEAVSMARRYCGTDAPGFVNGVLSAIDRQGTRSAESEAPA